MEIIAQGSLDLAKRSWESNRPYMTSAALDLLSPVRQVPHVTDAEAGRGTNSQRQLKWKLNLVWDGGSKCLSIALGFMSFSLGI